MDKSTQFPCPKPKRPIAVIQPILRNAQVVSEPPLPQPSVENNFPPLIPNVRRSHHAQAQRPPAERVLRDPFHFPHNFL